MPESVVIIRDYIKSYVNIFENDIESAEAVRMSQHFLDVIDQIQKGTFDGKDIAYKDLYL